MQLTEHLFSYLCSEKRIESIDERLTGIEDLLRDLAVSLPHGQGPSKGTGSWENVSRPADKNLLAATSQANAATEESIPEFEGESALSAHSVHASKIFEKAMGSSPHFEHKPEIIEALNSLKETVRKHSLPSAIHVLRFTSQSTRSPVDLSQLKMPPAEDVLNLLRSGKGNHSLLKRSDQHARTDSLHRRISRFLFNTASV